jgi:tRNA pseudouridine32 synthase / 23S rRNA pseudouridine746 synthase
MSGGSSTQRPFDEPSPGDEREAASPRISGPALPVPEGPLRIVHKGARFVVVDKPAWLLSVPGKGPGKQDCVAARVAAMFPEATGPLIVHRLDMETSGLMVLGLDPMAQRELSMQFERREVDKAYVALLGEPSANVQVGGAETLGAERAPLLPGESGLITLPIRTDIDDRPRQIVDFVHGKQAVTHWHVLAHETDRVRVRFVPETGRTHQLRVHAAAALKRPIVGDRLYGGEAAPRLMLHSALLSFIEPGGSRRAEFESGAGF